MTACLPDLISFLFLPFLLFCCLVGKTIALHVELLTSFIYLLLRLLCYCCVAHEHDLHVLFFFFVWSANNNSTSVTNNNTVTVPNASVTVVAPSVTASSVAEKPSLVVLPAAGAPATTPAPAHASPATTLPTLLVPAAGGATTLTELRPVATFTTDAYSVTPQSLPPVHYSCQ